MSLREVGTSKGVYSPKDRPLIQQPCAYYQDKDAHEDEEHEKSDEPAEKLKKGRTFSRQDSSTINDITSSREVLSAPELKKVLDNRWKQVSGRNDKEESDIKLAEAIYESCKSEQDAFQQEKSCFLPSDERNIQKASLVRAATIRFGEVGVELSQITPFIQRYLNYMEKSECNRQREETHFSQFQFGSNYSNCLKTASFSPTSTLFKGSLSVKLHADREEKRLVHPLGVSKHKMDILSPPGLEKCSVRMLLKLDIRGVLKDLAVDEAALLASSELTAPQTKTNDSRDPPLMCEDNTPLPRSLSTSGTTQAHKLSSRTKEIRLRMRRATERRYMDYGNSSSSSDECD